MAVPRRRAVGAAQREIEDSVSAKPIESETVRVSEHESSDTTAATETSHTDNGSAGTEAKANTSVSRSTSKKWGLDFWKRLASGLVLFAALVAMVERGHIMVCIGVIFMEIGMYREVLRLGLRAGRDSGRPLPLWLTIGWYFFWACQFLFYGKAVLVFFDDQRASFMKYPMFQYALRHHTFLSFVLYCTGFVGFVLSLRQDQYHKQFSYFGRALVALLLVVVQSHFMILNVTQGLIWFILPCALIIVNDSFAYFCGRAFGRHSLTALSPKKTWEGYIGAGVFTMITAFFLSDVLSRYPSLVCPVYSFRSCTIWGCPKLNCDPLPYAFIQKTVDVPLPGFTSIALTLPYRPIQLHAMALGLFASAIGPFGGFFASGAKRAFEIKDFANIFPGHGGVTDRVDCQLLMAMFTYVYVINYVKVNFVGSPDVGKVMSFVAELSASEQVQLVHEIATRLLRRGVDPSVIFNHTALGNAAQLGN